MLRDIAEFKAYEQQRGKGTRQSKIQLIPTLVDEDCGEDLSDISVRND